MTLFSIASAKLSRALMAASRSGDGKRGGRKSKTWASERAEETGEEDGSEEQASTQVPRVRAAMVEEEVRASHREERAEMLSEWRAERATVEWQRETKAEWAAVDASEESSASRCTSGREMEQAASCGSKSERQADARAEAASARTAAEGARRPSGATGRRALRVAEPESGRWRRLARASTRTCSSSTVGDCLSAQTRAVGSRRWETSLALDEPHVSSRTASQSIAHVGLQRSRSNTDWHAVLAACRRKPGALMDAF
jgi:hypothetical protein